MPESDQNGAAAPLPEADVAALVAQLEEEVRRAGPRHTAGARPPSARFHARGVADRFAHVSTDRPLGGRTGVVGTLYKPVKLVVRKLARWYVEPVFADQRAFNDALLKLIDDLYDQVDRLEAELRARDGAEPSEAREQR